MTDPILVPTPAPEISILMVVHGALEMTRLAVLRTLRHSAGSDARLIVVDNASSDGTREWLRLLARRGDIDLIESPVNAGHGAGLELARARTRSPYLVTLDSDAFPLADDHVPACAPVRRGAAAPGSSTIALRSSVVPHDRARQLDELGSFRDEKHQPRTGRRRAISVEL